MGQHWLGSWINLIIIQSVFIHALTGSIVLLRERVYDLDHLTVVRERFEPSDDKLI